MRQASKRDSIITQYIKDIGQSYDDIALLTDSNVHYVTQCIHKYHIDLVSYYDMCLAPSLIDSNIYFLFSDNGIEKKLKFKNNVVTPLQELTALEELYVKLNLGTRIAHHESGIW
tara:strand:+ start:1201 stop:1545 length:345 start_codon:yes stop_codon:yes gene_type:complete